MSTDDQAEIAKNIEAALREAPPVRVDSEQAETQNRELMLGTMQNMEAQRARLGNFCVSIGSAEDPFTYAVILATPIEEPYSNDYIQKARGKAVMGGGTDASSSLAYVFVTSRGFFQYDFHIGRSRLYNNDNKPPKQEGYAFQKIIEETQQRTDPLADFKKLYLSGLILKANSGSKDETSWKLEVADNTTVQKALRASIKSSQEKYRPSIEAAKETSQIAEQVNRQIGASEPEPAQPEAPKSKGGLFGWMRKGN